MTHALIQQAILAAMSDAADGTTVAIGQDEVSAAVALRDAGKVSLSGRLFSPDRVTVAARKRPWLFREREEARS